MLGYIPAIIFQSIGLGVPVIGIIVLLRKGEGKNNTFLVMANFGALLLNWGYFEFLRAMTYPTAISVYRFEYFGGVIFYLFFVLFIKSFFVRGKSSRIFIGIFTLFVIIEAASLVAVMSGSSYAYEAVTVKYREDDGKFFTTVHPGMPGEDPFLSILLNPDIPEAAQEGITPDKIDEILLGNVPESNGDIQPDSAGSIGAEINRGQENRIVRGYAAISVQHGVMLLVRYSFLTFILFVSLIASVIMTIKRKAVEERHKLIYLTGAETVVFLSLLMSVLGSATFNFAPLLVSLSVLSIICGTATGNFLTIADTGRGWILDHSDVMFIIVDKSYHYLDANEHAKMTFPELKELELYSVIPDNLMQLLIGDSENLERNGRQYIKRSEPIENRGRVMGYSILFMDMTSQYKLMEQLEVEKQKAIAANDAKSIFMSNMSHEIRTPMNAIVGMTEIMLRHEQSGSNLEYLNNIKNSGNALLSVINDILDFSKIESGKLEIIPDEYEIMSVLNDLSLIFLNRIGEKPIELIYDIDPGLPAKLYGDSGRIRQVILNIVNNAIKYTDEGWVKLSIEAVFEDEDDLMLQCSVEDTGIGIKEEDLPKLFSNFSQIDTKKNRGKEGTGLGLSIAKQLVEAMGGSVSVESVYGQGSCFNFSMRQRKLSDQKAAIVKRTDKLYVAGNLQHKESLDILRKLCNSYENIHFVELNEDNEAELKKPDFIFSDYETVNRLADLRLSDPKSGEAYPEIIVLQNPMSDSYMTGNEYTLMNKPLYTLNFCLAINHEMPEFKERHERLMSFKTKDASILVVDDNEMNRKVAAGLLEPLEINIDMAVNGKEAVEKVSEKAYDIVFMDHMMPIMDGIEATCAIRSMEGEYYAKLPIIALSANALAEARARFIEVGMNDFLAKPIKIKDLFQKVYQYLPPEKVYLSEQKLPNPGADEAELPIIEGLNVPAGVANSGGLKLFTSLLGDFYKLIERKATKIEKCLADEMIRDYTIEVHALKNTARMIGALELSDMFYELEQAGNAHDTETLMQKTEPALAYMRSYKPVLEPYAVSGNDEKADLTTEEIVRLVRSIRDAIESFDLDSADEAMKKLESGKVPENLLPYMEDLGAFVADVAMEEVVELCNNILERLL